MFGPRADDYDPKGSTLDQAFQFEDRLEEQSRFAVPARVPLASGRYRLVEIRPGYLMHEPPPENTYD